MADFNDAMWRNKTLWDVIRRHNQLRERDSSCNSLKRKPGVVFLLHPIAPTTRGEATSSPSPGNEVARWRYQCSTVYFLGSNSSLLFQCTEAVKLQKKPDPCDALPLCRVKKKTTSNFDKESLTKLYQPCYQFGFKKWIVIVKTGFSKDDLWKRLVEVSYEKRHGNIVCLKDYIETHGLGTMKLNF